MIERDFGRGSQVVRHGSAKAVFVGSIPTLASKISETLAAGVKKLSIDAGVRRLNPYQSVRVSEGSDKERVPA